MKILIDANLELGIRHDPWKSSKDLIRKSPRRKGVPPLSSPVPLSFSPTPNKNAATPKKKKEKKQRQSLSSGGVPWQEVRGEEGHLEVAMMRGWFYFNPLDNAKRREICAKLGVPYEKDRELPDGVRDERGVPQRLIKDRRTEPRVCLCCLKLFYYYNYNDK
jgi:hypothetical protein